MKASKTIRLIQNKAKSDRRIFKKNGVPICPDDWNYCNYLFTSKPKNRIHKDKYIEQLEEI